MTKKHQDVAARARRVAAGPAAAGAPAATDAPRARPVRITADLAPQSYRALISYCSSLAEELGEARVPHVAVLRALVAQLETDTDLQATIAERVGTELRK